MAINDRQIALRFAALNAEGRRGFLAKLQERGLNFAELPITTSDRTGPLPLSYSQRSLWLTWKLDTASAAYNIPGILHLSGSLNEAALRQSLEDLLNRHESLRTLFRSNTNEEPEQVISSSSSLRFPVFDLREQPVETSSQEGRELAETLARQPFKLDSELPFRAALIRVTDSTSMLVLVVHHIAADGWSLRILIDELIRFYEARATGCAAFLPELPIQFSDYAIWQRNWLQAGELDRQLAYWKRCLGVEHPVLELPTDRPRSAVRRSTAGAYLFRLPETPCRQLRALARNRGASLYMVMLALLKLMLHRFSGQTEIRVGSPVANRQRAETHGLIGYLTNVQVLSTQIDSSKSFIQLLAEIREMVLEAHAHQELPFDLLVEAMQPERQAGVHPLFQVKCTEQAELPGMRAFAGLEMNLEELSSKLAHFDLSLDFIDQSEGIRGEFIYSSELFDDTTIIRFAQAFRVLAEQAAQHPEKRLVDFRLPDPLAVLAGKKTDTHDQHVLAHVLALWARSVRQRKDAPAIRCEESSYSYIELDHAANQLARVLVESGVGPEVRVGILAFRTPEFVLAILAVLKAGGAYVPLDPQLPGDRIAYQLDNSGAQLLLAESKPAWEHALPMIELSFRISPQPALSLPLPSADIDEIVPHPDQAAYVIYTSGSTGRPKGVVVSHRALANYVQGVLSRLQLPDEASMAMISAPSADLGNTVLFGALCSGRLLHLISPERAFDPDRFADYMSRYRIDVLKIVPSHLKALLQAARAADVLPEHTLVVGGEPTGQVLLEQIRSLKPACRIVNHYGPTETTVGVLALAADDVCTGISTAALPMGQPLDNITAYVLDADLNPVAQGVVGELYLGGAGLARGYQGQPGLTAEYFLPNPFVDPSDRSGDSARLYRSGDRVRLLADGALEFLGRMDHQVKVRGFRIELGEIEAQLLGQAGVREAVVVTQEGPGGTRLVGYVTPDGAGAAGAEGAAGTGEVLDALELKGRLSEVLPDYMVPSALVVLECLPLNPNGKIDRSALPDPEWTGSGSGDYEAPQGEVEAALAAIWAEVLGIERVGRQDNFFELGGDSILSLQIVARLRRAGWKITPKQLFERQTVMSLAGVAERLPGIVKSGQPARDESRDEVKGEVPLLPIQAEFFQSGIPARHHWNQAVLLRSAGAFDTARLARALAAVVRHHDALRMRYASGPDGQWLQTYGEQGGEDLLWVRHADSAAGIEAWCDAAQRSLDLEKGPLLRAVAIEVSGGEWRLLLAVHHLVIDGVSWRILLEDLQAAYVQLSAGEALALPARTSPYQAWAQRLQDYARAHEGEFAYWQQLGEADASAALPIDWPEGANTSRHHASITVSLDRAGTEALLKDAPAAYRTQVNDLLLTSLGRALCRWSGHERIVIDLEGHGREDLYADIDLSRTIGWFTSICPVVLEPLGELDEGLKRVKEGLRRIPDKGIGYGIFKYLGTPGQRQALASLPQARIIFNYLGQLDGSFGKDGSWTLAEESAGAYMDEDAPRGHALSVNGQIYDGELKLDISYSAACYRPATIEALAEAYRKELQTLIAHCVSGAAGVTPSDFPWAGLTQAQLDGLPLSPAQIEDLYPLSPMQSGMLFHSLYEPDGSAYLNQLRVDIDGLDLARFHAAWRAVQARHDILRTGFLHQRETLLQWVAREVTLPFAEYDWRDRSGQGDPSDLDAALAELARADLARGFDLAHPPLQRLHLIRTGSERYHFIWTVHHLLLDGWSTSQLLGEVLRHYSGEALPPHGGRYRDYIAWLQSRDARTSEAYWREQLLRLEAPTRLAAALPRTESGTGYGGYGEHVSVLDSEVTQGLAEFARRERITLNTLVQAAWGLLLQRYTGQATVTFGATVAGRPGDLPGAEQLLGLFINTLPVITDVHPGQAVGDWLRELQAQNLASREHEHTPLYEIQRWAGQSGQGLFDSILVFENYPVDAALQEAAPGGLHFSEVKNQEETNYALTIGVVLAGEQRHAVLGSELSLTLRYSYARESFGEATVSRIAAHLRALLHELGRHPEKAVGEIELLDAGEHERLMSWGRNERRYAAAEPVHRLIEQQVRQRPDAVALIFGEEELSYGELNLRANRLAHRLIERGVGPDVRVGIALERSVEMIVGLLGILKAGGAYVPLDPAYPAERLAYMVEDSGIFLLLTQAGVGEGIPRPEGLAVMEVEEGEEGQGGSEAAGHDPQVALHGEHLAYVIYTSGSTGKPKGVGIPHHALVEHMQGAVDYLELTPADRMLQLSTVNFDAFAEQLYPPLCAGATVVLSGPALWDSETFYRELIDRHISVADLTTAYWLLLVQDFAARGQRDYGALRRVHVGGEAMPAEGIRAWREAGLGQVELFNLYGPTEAVVTASVSDCTALGEAEGELAQVAIGTPLAGRSIHILDGDLNPVGQGVAGELCIGGALLARGYLNRAGLTSERFVADPFDGTGGRLYRTGDLARWRSDGQIEYLGRLDHQVKVRGFRIELGEIEAQLLGQAGVREAVVVTQEGPGGTRLVGYVTPDGAGAAGAEGAAGTGEVLDALELKGRLSEVLPDYMVPSALVVLECLPLNPNGKIDRSALPDPEWTGSGSGDYEAPQGEVEAALAAIWAEVLGIERVGRQDNFFELGGDSILSLQIVARLRRAGWKITPKQLFERQTVMSLAGVAERLPGIVKSGQPARDESRDEVKGEVPLLPIQAEFFQSGIPARHHWNQAVLLRSAGAFDTARLARALAAVVRHHDALRMRYASGPDGQWLQTYGEQGGEDLLWVRHADSAAGIEAWCDAAQRSLDLEKGPLLRAVAIEVSGGEWRLLLAVHHLVIDGVSWRILLEDLQAAYVQLSAGEALALPARTSPYQAWAQRLQDYARAHEGEFAYWQQLGEADASAALPIDWPEGANTSRHHASITVSLDRAGTEALLKDAPAAYRTQVNDLLLTSLGRALCRWSGHERIVIDLEGHGREDLYADIDLSRTIGWFTSICPVVLEPLGELDEGLKRVKEGLRRIPDKGIGYGIFKYLGTPGQRQALASLPQARIIFNYLGQLDGSFGKDGSWTLAEESAGAYMDEDAPRGHALSVNGQIYDGELKLDISYSAACYRPATIEALAEAYRKELQTLIAHCVSGAAGVTPSDFPWAGLTQAQLDGLPLSPAQIEDLYPLSPMQSGMLFHSLYEPDGSAYLNQLRVDIDGLDLARFHAAWRAVQARHDILRTGFLHQRETLLQWVAREVTLPFAEYDWRDRSGQGDPSDLDAALAELARADLARGFDLAHPPLQRLHLIRTGSERYHFIWTVHHLLLDGWSTSQLLGEVLRHYSGEALPPHGGRYRDYIAWLQSRDARTSEAYWREQLLRLEAPTRLAAALPRTESGTGYGGYGEHVSVLDSEVTQGLAEFARRERITLNTLVQAAWGLLLQRYTGQATVTFGATVAGRPGDLPGAEQLLGLFINTLPVITDVHPGQAVGDWLRELQAQNLASREHEHTPLYEIQRWAGQSGQGLFDSILVFENYPVDAALQEAAPGGLHFSEVKNQEETNYALTIGVVLAGEQRHAVLGSELSLTLRYSYARESFGEATVSRIAAHLRALLHELGRHPEKAVGEIELLDAGEHERLMSWGRNERRYAAAEPVHRLIEQQVRQRPDAVALIFGEEELSYGELNLRANRLAHRLIERGVGPDVRVGIALERSVEMIVGLLGILKAGGAYVPLDPAYPAERLAYMVEDSGIFLLLTQAGVGEGIPRPEGLAVMEVEEGEEGQGGSEAAGHDPQVALHGEHLAYVIYTSGSTGKPKGVGIPHHALVEHAKASIDFFGLTAEDRMLQFATLNFDGFIEQVYPVLGIGAAIVLRGPLLWDSETFYRELIDRRISVADLTTAYWLLLVQDFAARGQRDYGALRRVHVGGEAMPAEGIRAWREAGLGQVELFNTYGPTEAVVTASVSDCTALGEAEGELAQVAIGTPLAGRSIHILDGDLNPVGQGVAGELCIGGALLARGYLNRAGLTSERFVADPFDGTGGRLYRTGDLARWRSDGQIEYLGRLDHQVKVRGFRIELGEIEAQLLGQAGVREAVVVTQEGPGGTRLVGYVTPDGAGAAGAEGAAGTGEVLDALELKGRLSEVLPDYMVPSALVVLECLPLNPNGKIDRSALPDPEWTGSGSGDYEAPQGEVEAALAAIWAEVLGIERVGRQDNFFELGGDSILSLQIVARLRRAGWKITPKQLFERQTVMSLAGVAERLPGIVKSGQPARDESRDEVKGEVPLLPIQAEFFQSGIPARHHWNQAVLLRSAGAFDTARLARALAAVVRHHDALRMRYASGPDGQWLQTYGEQGGEDLLWVRHADSAAGIEAWCDAAQRSLDLEKGPLLRAVAIEVSGGEWRLLLAVHHLVIDGVSWRILLEDLQAAYVQLSAGEALALPARTSPYQAWAQRLQDYARAHEGEFAYWQQLGEADASAALPIDWPEGANTSRHHASITVSLDRAGTEALLKDAPAAYRTQVNDLLLTSLGRALCRWSGHERIVIDLEGHGREDLYADIDLSRTIGWFTSICPVVLEPLGELDEGLKRVKEGLRRIPDKGIGYGIFKYLGTPGQRQALASLPQARIIFNYLGQLDGSFGKDGSWTLAEESAGAYMDEDAPRGHALSVNGQIYDGELKLDISYSAACYRPATIEALAEAYRKELQTLIAHCVSGAAGVTPSDFPWAGLTQAQLDGLPLSPAQIEDLYPLSPMQSGMLFHSLYEPDGSAYLNQLRVDIDGLDLARFHAAWRAVQARHDILRTGFLHQRETLLQWVAREVTLPFAEYDWRDRSGQGDPSDLDAALAELARADLARGFDLAHPPLQRLHLIRTGSERYHFIWTVHHLLLDGWSTSQLLGEVLRHYSGEALPPHGGRYRDYIAWLQSRDARTSEAYWREQLLRLEAPTRLAAALPRTESGTGYGGYGEHVSVLDSEVTQGLAEFARRERITLNTLVQAAWGLLLQRYTGQATVTFGATVAGRPGDLPGAEQLLGLFINTLPVITDVHPGQAVGDWLRELQAQNLASREHEHTPLYEIQRWAGQSGQGLFDSILVFENYPVDAALQEAAPGGLHFSEVKNQEETNYALTIGVVLAGEQRHAVLGSELSLTLRYSYARESFGEATVSRIAAHLRALLHELGRHPEKAVGEIELLDAGEHERLMSWGRNERRYAAAEPVHRLIEQQVRQRPDAVALIFGEEELSYGELNLRANRLAHRLIERGVGPDVRVGIALERSVEMIVGLLGILKAGGAYVPLDPAYPAERLAYMVEDSGIFLLLTQAGVGEGIPRPEGLAVMEVEEGEEGQGGSEAAGHDPQVALHGEHLAYVIYTSGSTGKPKGVGNRHRALYNRLTWMQEAYGLNHDDCVLQKTPFSFDVSVWEFFWPLMTGARLAVAAPGDHRDPARIVALIQQHRVTTLHFVPSMLQIFMAHEGIEACTDPSHLSRIICSGEALLPEMQAKVFERLPGVELHNLYGPTEAAIDVTYWKCIDEGKASIPIGRPIANIRTCILDPELNLVPVGVAGELYLGGMGLARGYLNRAGLTSERFVADPFDGTGGRLYRTGDLARWRSDGQIEYLGRLDHQVKVRGFRIELGEIEAQLLGQAGVREAVVVTQEGPGGTRLVGYVTPDGAGAAGAAGAAGTGEVLDALELKGRLSEVLPDYMVPSALVVLECLPLNPNGKIDRSALPDPEWTGSGSGDYEAPQGEVEAALAAIWAEVLGIERVGRQDNFFELGGHSLTAVQVCSRIQIEMRIDVPLHVLFETATFKDFVDQITEGAGGAAENKLKALEAFMDTLETV